MPDPQAPAAVAPEVRCPIPISPAYMAELDAALRPGLLMPASRQDLEEAAAFNACVERFRPPPRDTRLSPRPPR